LNLSRSLFRSYGINEEVVTLKVDAENIKLGIETATQCGLIINELLSNSLKYAFPDGRKGEIFVALHKSGKDGFELEVSDNGVGMPEEIDFFSSASLGLKLIKNLSERQLKGKIEIKRSKGTKIRITFKQLTY